MRTTAARRTSDAGLPLHPAALGSRPGSVRDSRTCSARSRGTRLPATLPGRRLTPAATSAATGPRSDRQVTHLSGIRTEVRPLTNPSHRWHFSGRGADPFKSRSFASQAAKSPPGDSSRSRVASTARYKHAAERLHLKAANRRCRPVPAVRAFRKLNFVARLKTLDSSQIGCERLAANGCVPAQQEADMTRSPWGMNGGVTSASSEEMSLP